MGLSDTEAIVTWLRSRGVTTDPDRHDWLLSTSDGSIEGEEDRSVRAICRSCGLIRRKPLSLNAEIFIDLGGPCPADSSYWLELQQKRHRDHRGG